MRGRIRELVDKLVEKARELITLPSPQVPVRVRVTTSGRPPRR